MGIELVISIFLALVAVFVGGLVFGIWCTVRIMETRFPMTWKILVLEAKAHKQKRADAARNKEA